MAVLTYQGPVPLPSARFARSLPWGAFVVKGPTFTTSGVSPLYAYDASLPAGAITVAYSQTLTGGGGTPPYTFALASGSLPPGLSLSSGGVISGTPTTLGTYVFTVAVTDARPVTATQPFAITVVAAAAATTGSANSGYTG